MSTQNLLIGFLVIVVLLGAALYLVPHSTLQPVACTMEAKICPDGTAVGRTGPNCEFAECPQSQATSTSGGVTVVGPGEHCGGNIRFAPVCASGYHCQLVISRPDTGGTCVADSSGGGGILPYKSGIEGSVLLGPTCPVMRDPPDPQCADRPYQTTVTVAHAGSPSQVFAQTQSAADGTFQVSLPPGEYVVDAKGGAMLPRCAQTPVTVGASAYAHITVSCDTGIR